MNKIENLNLIKTILVIAKNGKQDDLVKVLRDRDGETMTLESQKYFSELIDEERSDFVPVNNEVDTNLTNNNKNNQWTSVLLTAVNSRNKEICDHLINKKNHLIQQLPFEHQVRISTEAFKSGQLDVFYNLLNFADYPFPEDLNIESLQHDKLNEIMEERNAFEIAINNENIHGIAKFIDKYSNLKVVYNINNKSSLKQAVDASKLKSFIFLKFRGFHTTNPDEDFEKVNREASIYAAQQRKQNVTKGLKDEKRFINSLCNRSIIHNKRISKEQEKKYRLNIRNWYESIYKIPNGPEFLQVAASCERLKIIFDFECDTVESVSLASPNAGGSTYAISKWIFIGAKFSDEMREQQIKGVLAHELCHYVMKLVYDSQENPYHKDRHDIRRKFRQIVKRINKWSSEASKNLDDECNGIISSVFTLYPKKDFSPELIVRVVQILTEFYNYQDLIQHLQVIYADLFNFWINQVVPDLQNYLLKNKEVIKLNRLTRLLRDISEHQIEIKPGKKIEELVNSKLAEVTTNNPQLLFIDICKNLKEKFGILIDSRNFFTDAEKLNNQQISDELKHICADNQKLNIFVDCTKRVKGSLRDITIINELNYIFVMSNDSRPDELPKFSEESIKMDINYSWSDLTEESQNLLLQNKINFQNNPQIPLADLLKHVITEDQQPVNGLNINLVETSQNDFSDLISDKLLNMLVQTEDIVVNSGCNDRLTETFFDLLYEPRKFSKKTRKLEERKEQVILEGELLKAVKNQKYVLISDMAGNGKSWAMKNVAKFLREVNSTNWVTYVDLKQFIDEFRAQITQLEFSAFLVEKILKSEQPFEARIFQKMYKDGKVFILFDGFDEIAPDCAEFVSKLAHNFQWNGGNQLWIATRNYFEIDLKEKLQLSAAFSLKEMTEDEGVNMIAKSWVLTDLIANKCAPKSTDEFEANVQKSSKYQSYQQKARKIIKTALISRNISVGLPQMFKMIADGFKEEENVDDLQGSKIYVKFIKVMYKRWSEEKGKIRNEASIDSQDYELNFNKFHQYHAIRSLFSKLVKYLFLDYDGSEWPIVEIIACGIMSIKDGKVYFLHETFREYFVADFIIKALKKPRVSEKVVELIVEVLTVEKFAVIRKFLNDMITDDSTLAKIQLNIQKHIDKFNEMTSFGDFFTKNLTNLIDFVLEILKSGNDERVKAILNASAEYIAINTSESEMFKKFQEFIFIRLKIDDLKDLIIHQEVFQGIIESRLNIDIFENFVTKAEAEINREFVRKGLMLLLSNYYWKGNIFYSLSHSTDLNAYKVQKFLQIIEKYLSVSEIFELLKKCNKFDQNVLQVCIEKQNKENIEILWTEIEKYFAVREFPKSFKEFVKQRDKDKRNILHCVAWCEKVEFHEIFWTFLLKTFQDREELKDFILQKDKDRNNFLHKLISHNKVPAIIEMTFNIQKENLNDVQLQEILKSKDGWWEMNFLQTAANLSTPLEIHQFLWEFFQIFCKTKEEFWKMLNEIDENGQNILHITARSVYSSSEIFEFMIQKLEEIASQDEIKEMLGNLNWWNQNLLQSAAWLSWNISSDFHATLWRTFRKYFKKSDILQFIKNVDRYGNNLLFNVVEYNNEKFVELTLNEIQSFLSHDELSEYLKLRRKNDKNLLEFSSNKYKVYNWIKQLMEKHEVIPLIAAVA